MKPTSLLLGLLICHTTVIAAWAASPRNWSDPGLDGASGPSTVYNWTGGSGTLQAWGSFAGSPTVTLEWQSVNSAPWEEANTTDCTFTAPGFCNFSVGNGDLRLNVVSGSGIGIVKARIGEPNQASTGTAQRALTAGAVDFEPDGIFEIEQVLTPFTGIAFDPDDDGDDDVIFDAPDPLFGRFRTTAETYVFELAGSLIAGIQFSSPPGLGTISGAFMVDATPSTTLPTLLLSRLDSGSGLGKNAVSGGPVMIDDSVAVAEWTAAGLSVTDLLRFEFPQSAVAPTPTESGSYWDSAAKELCIYDGTQWICLSSTSGELHQTNPGGGGGPHITVAVDGTFVGWTTASAGPVEGGVVVDLTDATGDTLQLPTDGIYVIGVSMSFGGSSNDTFTCRAHVNGLVSDAFFVTETNPGGAVQAAAGFATLSLFAGDKVSMRCTTEPGDGGGTMDIWQATMSVGKY
jgi:hypothetical protein